MPLPTGGPWLQIKGWPLTRVTASSQRDVPPSLSLFFPLCRVFSFHAGYKGEGKRYCARLLHPICYRCDIIVISLKLIIVAIIVLIN